MPRCSRSGNIASFLHEVNKLDNNRNAIGRQSNFLMFLVLVVNNNNREFECS